MYKAVAD